MSGGGCPECGSLSPWRCGHNDEIDIQHAIDCDMGEDCSCAQKTAGDEAKPDPKYVCVRCGGVDIEVTAWIDPNAEEITTTDIYNDDSWCNDCEEHDTVVTFAQYQQYQEHKRKEQAHADDRTD